MRQLLAPSMFFMLLLASIVNAASMTIGNASYTIDSFSVPSPADANPLSLDVAWDKKTDRIWMVPEFDHRVYYVVRDAAANTAMTAEAIPAPGTPLFRGTTDVPSFNSGGAERIQTTSDGSVWVSQGGTVLYGGTNNNYSRLMRRRPDGVWNAYTLPINSAGATGFYAEDPPNRVWVMTAIGNALYYTRVRWWHENEVSATAYPPSDQRWERVRDFGSRLKFPGHIIRLKDNRLAGTLYFGTAFFIYDPDTLNYQLTQLAPAPPGANAGSSGPWQLAQDTNGDLWIVEDFAKRVTKVTLTTGAQTIFDFSGQLSANEGLHSIVIDASGDVYVTSYTIPVLSGSGRLIRITNGVAIVGPTLASVGIEVNLGGIIQTTNGEFWAAATKSVLRITKN